MNHQRQMSKILIVDDEPAIVRVLANYLCSDGYDVLSAHNGEEALAVFRSASPEIVLTDIKMPGMDGIEVLRKIKALQPSTEVIIMAAHGDIDYAIEALRHGASDFLNKPIGNEALSIALARTKEKFTIRRQLKAYTVNLENKVYNATRELRRQFNFRQKLILSATDAIVASDENFQVVVFNPGAERIFGYTGPEVIQRAGIMEFLPQGTTEKFNLMTNSPSKSGGLQWQETTIISKDGTTIPVRFFGTLLLEKGAIMGMVAFFQDIREIKRLEEELVASERLAAVGQMVAGLAHGVKNILHGLEGGHYLVDLGIKKGNTSSLTTGWDMLKRNIGRMSVLAMDLLNYSKERVPEFKTCCPNEIAGDVCELLSENALAAGVQIVKEFDSKIDTVQMDPDTIHSALTNLLTNAIDACLFDEPTSKHFQVNVKTALRNNGWIEFQVEDNGTGMNAEVQEKLFTSFFSTKGHRGTGLGLHVTRKLVEEHYGTIRVRSQPGKGTCFIIRLPFHPTPLI
jgi:two-component system NtrC family sensor kinase